MIFHEYETAMDSHDLKEKKDPQEYLPDFEAVIEQYIPEMSRNSGEIKENDVCRMSRCWNINDPVLCVFFDENKKPKNITFDSALFDLRKLLSYLRLKGKDVPFLPVGGKLCEIGGPSYIHTTDDIVAIKPEITVIANPHPGLNLVEIYELEGAQGVVKSSSNSKYLPEDLNIAEKNVPVEELDKLESEFGKFDFITAYNVFGTETEHIGASYMSRYGADLSDREKRIAILKKIASMLNNNGIFITTDYSGKCGFQLDEVEEAGFIVPKITNKYGDEVLCRFLNYFILQKKK